MNIARVIPDTAAALGRSLKRFTRSVLRNGLDWLNKYPGPKKRIVQHIGRYPRLDPRLRRIAATLRYSSLDASRQHGPAFSETESFVPGQWVGLMPDAKENCDAAYCAVPYCAAPWIAGILGPGGTVLPCCNAPVNLGDWLDSDLESAWHSEKAIRLRQAIADGEFINDVCRACYHRNGVQPLTKLVDGALMTHARAIVRRWPQYALSLNELRTILTEKEFGPRAEWIMTKVGEELDTIEKEHGSDVDISAAIGKMRTIVQILRDFFQGNTKPTVVAPRRSVGVIGVCNARCIQCPASYLGTLEGGVIGKDGTRRKYLELDQIIRGLTSGDDIINFFPNATEIPLYPHWREFLLHLPKIGLKLDFSSNGMAMTRKHTEFMVDNDVLGVVNFSLDASTKEIYEEIRVGLVFEKVVDNISYFFRYAARKDYFTNVGLSFCLMKRNYSDLPGFVDLAASFRQAGDNKISVRIGVQSLVLSGPSDYLTFVDKEHISTIDPIPLGNAFAEMQERAEAMGIQVNVFDKGPLAAFNEEHLNTLLSGHNPFERNNELGG